jgi:carbon starvation protein
VGLSAVVLIAAYFTYGRFLSRFLALDATRPTPAVEMRDGVDYDPIEPKFLLSQHFSAIAAAGPIVGPVLAGIYFGWLPALLWILIGSIFIGGVHDMTALAASIRHRARSIAEVVRDHMSQLSYILFLIFIWISLVYIIVAFTDITAGAFIGGPENVRRGEAAAPAATAAESINASGGVTGGAIATSSLLYLALPVIMGLLLRYTRLSLGWATLIFVPLVGVVIWVGQFLPLDLGIIVQSFQPNLTLQDADITARKIWDVLLLVYCLVAGVVPVWMLLQPRGHLGGFFLYAALAAGIVGVMLGGFVVEYDDFKGWNAVSKNGETFFPFLFVIIACGACSGFHALIASGTTSKQLRRETDAKPIAYGAMLLEGMVATLALRADPARPRSPPSARRQVAR